MAWDQTAAVISVRGLIGDNGTDKYVFKQDCIPVPDGINTRFFGGDSRVVPGTLFVNVATSGFGPSGYIPFAAEDDTAGWFELPIAPSANIGVQASYYYQWFTDDELVDFLGQTANLLGFETVEDEALPTGLRPALLHWAASKAFAARAANYADSLSALAPGGYGIDKKEASPNWARLSQQKFDEGKKLLDIYASNPLVSKAPQLAFAAFRMATYVPKT